ncbi:MAG: class 1 isoprenoid biosynthesis enzyme [Gemmatimonadetes bacterium]|nr:class 1 isoprenoid biosynthesis enzyme [Gemmatimonadota bacterium]MDA1103994.1 class 1 isoprenoid biosynthesis enzyme [Gemmatimonadota bacterium]
MTLSPVFRSPSAVQLLAEQGVWRRLAPDMVALSEAVRRVYTDFEGLIDERFRTAEPHVPTAAEVTTPEGLHFLQEYFFLILFRSIFGSLGVPEDRLQTYTELNFCIKGTVTAADNLFDDQAKSLLPLADHAGSRFMSILQLMSFERLLRNVLDRAAQSGIVPAEKCAAVQRTLMDRMASIGVLEGSEEGGVHEIPHPDVMVEAVHRVRGGSLFALAFAAPSVLESGSLQEKMAAAERSIAQLGTAFQIVDDLTDFEFDVQRRTHNLLVSQIHHLGSEAEQAALAPLWAGAEVPPGAVESLFRDSARAVLERAYREARSAFAGLAALGHWFDPALADEVVHAIVGLEGVTRMETLAEQAVDAG